MASTSTSTVLSSTTEELTVAASIDIVPVAVGAALGGAACATIVALLVIYWVLRQRRGPKTNKYDDVVHYGRVNATDAPEMESARDDSDHIYDRVDVTAPSRGTIPANGYSDLQVTSYPYGRTVEPHYSAPPVAPNGNN
jgi:hypothetical protein